jgi:HK97 family phage prohead protease
MTTPTLDRALTRASLAPNLTTFSTPPSALTADVAERIVEGLILPFNAAGATSDGLLMFAEGDLTWHDDVSRVKLLVEHDQNRAVGHAVELRNTPAGVWGRFRVATGADGDAVLHGVAERIRDGLSVGVNLDAATYSRIRRAQPGQAIAAAGRLRETSAVTVPAFDDARAASRVPAMASGRLTTMNGGQGDPAPTSTPTPPPPTSTPATAAPAAPAAPAPATSPAGQQGAAAGGDNEPLSSEPTTASGPRPTVRAAAGAVTVTSEPTTYRFDGSDGLSFVRDAYRARIDGDPEAAARVARFNAELRSGNAQAVTRLMAVASGALTTAAPGDPIPSPATTDDTGIPTAFMPNVNRPDLMLRAIDLGRPILSRLTRTPITNAQPFLVPIEGEFEGVGYHVEGTPHVPAGTFTLNDAPVTPRSVSGAYEVSRELVDAFNPAIDGIVMRAMLRDYRRKTETWAAGALAAGAPATGNVDTAMEVRASLAAFVNDDDETADFVAASRGFISALYAEIDGNGRPMIAGYGNASAPSAGASRAGFLAVDIDGTELVRANRVAANTALAVRSAGVLFAESAAQQFRFDEILGPGVIKLALWAYFAIAKLEADAVEVFTTAPVGG